MQAVLRAGGVTLQQLTGVCKDISEGKREILSTDCSSESKPTKVVHPFQVKESQLIAINIKVRFYVLSIFYKGKYCLVLAEQSFVSASNTL